MADVITRFKVESTQYEKKIKDAKKGIDDFKKSGSGMKDVLGGIEKSLGVDISSLAKFGTALGAVAAAAKVAKDVFMSMESNIDELGRKTEACKGAYDVFTHSLASGNWDNFLNRLKEAITGARDLYDALDRLGSVRSNNRAAIAIQQQAIQQLRLRQKGGENVDSELTAATDRLAYLQGQEVTAGKAAGQKQMTETLATAGVAREAIDALVKELLEGGQDAFDKYAAQYASLTAKGTKSRDVYDMDGNWGGTQSYFDINSLSKEEQNLYTIARAITERETKLQEGISSYAQAIQASTSNTKEQVKNVGYVGSNSSSVSSYTKSGSLDTSNFKSLPTAFADLNQQADALTKKLSVIPEFTIKAFSVGSINDYNNQIKSATDILNGLTIGTEEYAAQLAVVNDLQSRIGASKSTTTLANDGRNAAAAWSSACGAINNVGSMLSGLEDPSAKIVGLIAQSIASVASGAGQAMSAKDTTSSGWAWIGAAAAITAEMITIISTIKSNTQYHAAGGFVGSNGLSRGTDTVPAMLTPGELVLNSAQQANLASHLGGDSRGASTASVGAEDILIKLNNYGRRTGRGRIKFE